MTLVIPMRKTYVECVEEVRDGSPIAFAAGSGEGV